MPVSCSARYRRALGTCSLCLLAGRHLIKFGGCRSRLHSRLFQPCVSAGGACAGQALPRVRQSPQRRAHSSGSRVRAGGPLLGTRLREASARAEPRPFTPEASPV